MLRHLLVSVVMVGSVSVARADYSAHSCRGPASGPVRATVTDNACTGFVVSRPGARAKTVTFPFVGSGDLRASADGRTVVMIQSYLYGHIDEHGKLVDMDAPKVVDPIGIYVYRDGKLVARHTVRALLARLGEAEQSISHVRWVKTIPASIGKTFTLEMVNGRTAELDARTGRIVAQTDPAATKP